MSVCSTRMYRAVRRVRGPLLVIGLAVLFPSRVVAQGSSLCLRNAGRTVSRFSWTSRPFRTISRASRSWPPVWRGPKGFEFRRRAGFGHFVLDTTVENEWARPTRCRRSTSPPPRCIRSQQRRWSFVARVRSPLAAFSSSGPSADSDRRPRPSPIASRSNF